MKNLTENGERTELFKKVPLKELLIKRELSEDTRIQGVNIGGIVFSLHKSGDEYIITDNEDYSMIYQITSCDLWSLD